jgi:hypothetical protein
VVSEQFRRLPPEIGHRQFMDISAPALDVAVTVLVHLGHCLRFAQLDPRNRERWMPEWAVEAGALAALEISPWHNDGKQRFEHSNAFL